jgi:hypothetical protein
MIYSSGASDARLGKLLTFEKFVKTRASLVRRPRSSRGGGGKAEDPQGPIFGLYPNRSAAAHLALATIGRWRRNLSVQDPRRLWFIGTGKPLASPSVRKNRNSPFVNRRSLVRFQSPAPGCGNLEPSQIIRTSELWGSEGDVSPSWGSYKGVGPLRRNR